MTTSTCSTRSRRNTPIGTAVILAAVLMLGRAHQLFATQVYELDKRSASEQGEYLIGFAGYSAGGEGEKKSLTGHAFLIIAETNDQKKVPSIDAVGIYPVKGKEFESVVHCVKLEVGDDILSGAYARAEWVLKVRVDKSVVADIRKLIADRLKDGEYQAGRHDCVEFCKQAAKAVGLNVPKDWDSLWPSKFMRELIDENHAPTLPRKNDTTSIARTNPVIATKTGSRS